MYYTISSANDRDKIILEYLETNLGINKTAYFFIISSNCFKLDNLNCLQASSVNKSLELIYSANWSSGSIISETFKINNIQITTKIPFN